MFDLLLTSPLLRDHIAERKAAFGINHTMYDFRTNRKKDLDLVVCTPAANSRPSEKRFSSFVPDYQIVLSDRNKKNLLALPDLPVQDVGNVLAAVEAKACMTAHQRARPRLYDELSASQQVMHGESEQCVATALILVNASGTFISPTENKRPRALDDPTISINPQPQSAIGVIEKIAELPRRSAVSDRGFDAIGLLVCDAANDGSEITILQSTDPLFTVPNVLRYSSMIQRVVRDYATRFRSL